MTLRWDEKYYLSLSEKFEVKFVIYSNMSPNSSFLLVSNYLTPIATQKPLFPSWTLYSPPKHDETSLTSSPERGILFLPLPPALSPSLPSSESQPQSSSRDITPLFCFFPNLTVWPVFFVCLFLISKRGRAKCLAVRIFFSKEGERQRGFD